MRTKLAEAIKGENDRPRKEAKFQNFDSFGLDARLLKSIAQQKYPEPTLVQTRAIPAALQGKDIIARSRTGSGKTAAYVLPILHSILKRKSVTSQGRCIRALILVPTRELAAQVSRVVQLLSESCRQEVSVENIARNEDEKVERARLDALPDVVVSTPGRVAANLKNSALSLADLGHLVIDEADLILSYDYGSDLEVISQALPTAVQTFLMSATLIADVLSLKKQFCHDPVMLELEEETRAANVTQYFIRCAEDEKFLLAYAIFKLKLVKGKCIVFVEGIDRCYRLKLFFEQFGIKSCILNSELPVNSRIHVVEEFNKNIYDIIIATDEHEVMGDEGRRVKRRKKSSYSDARVDVDASKLKSEDQDEMEKVASDEDCKINDAVMEDNVENCQTSNDTSNINSKKKRKPGRRDKEYGISRGIDFKNVACVLNFDLPTSSESYTHRIGRTARMGKSGMALSFVVPKHLYRKDKVTSIPSCEKDEDALATITADQEKSGHTIQPYNIDMDKLAGFRYRMTDALKAVTQLAIRQARTRELRQELLNSEKLKTHFEENPTDLQHLRHDDELRVTRLQHHLRHVPDYLLPNGPKKSAAQDLGFIAFNKPKDARLRNVRAKSKGFKGRGGKTNNRRGDPLKVFTAAVRR